MRRPPGYCYIETGLGDMRFIPNPGPKPFAWFAEFSREHIARDVLFVDDGGDPFTQGLALKARATDGRKP